MVFCWHPHLCSWQIHRAIFPGAVCRSENSDCSSLVFHSWYFLIGNMDARCSETFPNAVFQPQASIFGGPIHHSQTHPVMNRIASLMYIPIWSPYSWIYPDEEHPKSNTQKKGPATCFCSISFCCHNQFLELSSLGDFRTLLKSWTESWENLIVGPPRNRIYMNLHQFNTSHCMTH